VKNGGLTNVARTDTINGGNINTSGSFQINGVSINTNGTLNNVAYLNGNNANTGRPTWADLVTFNDSVKIGSTSLFYLNGKLNSNTSIIADTIFSNSLIPTSDASKDIGSTSIGWRNGFFTGDVRVGTSGEIYANARGRIQFPSDTSIYFYNNARTRYVDLYSGNLYVSPPQLSFAQSISAFNLTQTWNTSGTPTAFKMNIINTASNSASLLMDLQVGGVSQLSVSRAGLLTIAGSLSGGAVATFGNYNINGGQIIFVNRSTIQSPVNNNLLVMNNAGNDFGLFQYGGTTSSYPAWKRNAAGLDLKLADDSGFGTLNHLYRRTGTGSPEGVVTAPIGTIYIRTDGSSGTILYFKDSGAGNTGWVAKW